MEVKAEGGCGEESNFWMAGIRKARVLPVPVLACARTSCPARIVGSVAACT